jgi:NDP-sugar pyrophosphorylase family protein
MPSLPHLFDELVEPWASAYASDAPWQLLGESLDRILGALPSEKLEVRCPPEVHLVGDRIAVGAGTRIHPGATIEGPAFIGREVEIRSGAFLRGGVWIGDGCVVGASSEVKHSIMLEGSRAPHLNYVGDSILGRGVNLGAGTILSNFRHDGREIRIPEGGARIPTGRRKLGAVLGDGVNTGCNCVLHPGVIVGKGSQLYPGVHLRPGIYGAQLLVKLRQQLEFVAKRED